MRGHRPAKVSWLLGPYFPVLFRLFHLRLRECSCYLNSHLSSPFLLDGRMEGQTLGSSPRQWSRQRNNGLGGFSPSPHRSQPIRQYMRWFDYPMFLPVSSFSSSPNKCPCNLWALVQMSPLTLSSKVCSPSPEHLHHLVHTNSLITNTLWAT